MKQNEIEALQNQVKALEKKALIDKQLIDALKVENAELQQKCGKCPNQPQRYTLLKSIRRMPDGKRYDNLYLQVKALDGKTEYAPIAIELVKFNPKQKNLLLAIAKPCEIRRVTLVSDLNNPSGSVSITTEGENE